MLTLGNYSLLNRCACLLATSCETICNPIHFLHRLVPKNIRREKTNKPNYSLLYCTPQTFKAFGFNLVLSMSQDNCRMFLLDTLMKSCTDLFFPIVKRKRGREIRKKFICENPEIDIRMKEWKNYEAFLWTVEESCSCL